MKNSPSISEAPSKNCGGNGGIVSASGTAGTTVCSKYDYGESKPHKWLCISFGIDAILQFAGKAVPFRLEFISDGYEISKASTEGVAAITSDGAKVQFFQTACWSIFRRHLIYRNT